MKLGSATASTRALEESGLRWRDTPRELAATAEVVFTSLPENGGR
jgi:3-hydroxyisobutyrate dehydrogenase-like beta-hydroxyacid dehydrogenase